VPLPLSSAVLAVQPDAEGLLRAPVAIQISCDEQHIIEFLLDENCDPNSYFVLPLTKTQFANMEDLEMAGVDQIILNASIFTSLRVTVTFAKTDGAVYDPFMNIFARNLQIFRWYGGTGGMAFLN
jgi:hypothetical protein